MTVANLARQLERVGAEGYPSDGSRRLPRRLERLCSLLAAEDRTLVQVAEAIGVSRRTVIRVKAHPLVRARAHHLREQVRAEAFDAAPLADRRNRIVAAARTAARLREKLEASDYETVTGYTEDGTPIMGHDRWATQHFLDSIALVDKLTGGSAPTTTTAATQTTISIGDAVVRVQALLSRTSDGSGNPEGPR